MATANGHSVFLSPLHMLHLMQPRADIGNTVLRIPTGACHVLRATAQYRNEYILDVATLARSILQWSCPLASRNEWS